VIKAGNHRYAPSGFFHLRTPLLPLDELTAWSDGLEAPGAADLEAAIVRDRALLRERLAALAERPAMREALALASPGLEGALGAWRDDPASFRGRKVERTLVRYLARAATRPTPFGLFAGGSVGTIGRRTELELGPASEYRRRSRLDMDYLHALAAVVAPELRHSLTYRPSTSLYEAGSQVRYVEVRTNGDERTHHLVAAERSRHLDAALARAADGATFAELVEAVGEAGAEGFVEDLIDAQLLVGDHGFHLTGPEPTDDLAGQLAAHQAGAVLATARDELAALDAGGLGAAPGHYARIADRLERLPAPVERSRLFQVDMVKPASATLGGAVLADIERGAGILATFARPVADELTALRDRFVARYEGRPVPLVEFLDAEGAEPSPLLSGLPFPGAPEAEAPWGRREEVLLAALTSGRSEVELSAADLERMAEDDPTPLPDAFDVMARVAADGRVHVSAVSGPSGARLLGRFCHADPELRAHVHWHLRAEEALDPDAIYAEVVHLPEGRMGNILARPALRLYEIPYLGRSGAEHEIAISDLILELDGDQLVLRSRRLGKRVVPRLTSAHNYGRGLPLYRFLGMLQRGGGVGGVFFDWGPLARAPFLPRLTSGRLVLSLATWRLDAAELKRLYVAPGPEQYRAVQELRERRSLPRLVTVADGDRVLTVDLDNVLSVESFVQLVTGREEATLVEPFDGLAVEGPEGRYAGELVVPFVRRGPARPAERARPRVPGVRRSFPPGSEWTYAKLYCGRAAADRILAEQVAPLARLADRWFFIRYEDPDFHLRVRFRGLSLEEVAAELPGDGRVAFDTYEREIERYGAVEAAEEIFHADSDAVLEILGLLEPGDAGADERWRMALAGADALMGDLGLDEAQRRDLMHGLRSAFGREFRVDARLARALGERLGRERAALEDLLEAGDDHPLAPGLEVLRRRSARIAPLGPAPLDVAASHVHMHCNRMMRSAPRAHELVLYDFLARLYESRAARARRAAA
jgi:thiopeptide-type bacteriocin biosynthesis protein